MLFYFIKIRQKACCCYCCNFAKNFLTMNSNLIQLQQQFPDLAVTIKLADLIEANQILIENAKAELEQKISDSKGDTYLTTERVIEMMGVSKTTLWRWKQKGYLVPVRIGGNDRYKLSDINRIIEGE